MFLDEHTILDTDKLLPGHPGFWLEDAIIVDVFNRKKPIHDSDHEAQLIHWGCKPEHTSKLTIRKIDGEYRVDRLYHCMLHLRYWKELSINMQHVSRFEEQFNFNLDELTLPSPSAEGNSAY